jgi:hypothetical protein
MRHLVVLIFLISLNSIAQQQYTIEEHLSEDKKLEMLKMAFSDCAKHELNQVYSMLKRGLISVNEYKLKSDGISSNFSSIAGILSKFNIYDFNLNKMPTSFQIYYDKYDFKFVINGNHMKISEFYSYLIR